MLSYKVNTDSYYLKLSPAESIIQSWCSEELSLLKICYGIQSYVFINDIHNT